jgi:RNA-dependent RNA polymerase
MDYDPPKRKIIEDRPVEITDISDFFTDFMLNNKLGQIANLHLALAEYNEEGGKFLGCKILAGLVRNCIYIKLYF